MRFVSLFSGAGGLDLGLVQAGFRPLFALDNDPHCAESHRANFAGIPFHLGSVTELTPELARELSSGQTLFPLDLLAGGPPCPPFSKSRFYRKEKPRALDDANGFETITGYIHVLQDMQPRAFLLENVFGLTYDVHAGALTYILDAARDAGYETTYRALNAADFAVPQIRDRPFIIGIKGKRLPGPHPTH